MKRNYLFCNDDFEVFQFVDLQGNVVASKIGRFPMVYWPDGRWCFEVNAWFVELVTIDQLSVRTRGGSLLTYAAHVSPLLKFCFFNKVRLIDLTNNDFSAFIHTLISTRQSGSRGRSSGVSYIRAVGHTCLRLLQFVGTLHSDPNFVSVGGRISCIETRRVRPAKRKRGQSTETYLSHPSLPISEPIERRLPMSGTSMTKLNSAAQKNSPSRFISSRRRVMLLLLEVTGARRVELSWLRIEHIVAAQAMDVPRIKMIVVKGKRRREKFRMVPVSRVTLQEVRDFIDLERRAVVRRTCGRHDDAGCVFIGERTGKRMSAESITTEISVLRRAAGITQKASAHMFRHRRITKFFVDLIQIHGFKSADEFRAGLWDLEWFHMQLMEFTGQSDPESATPYLHMAFDEVFRRPGRMSSLESRENLDATVRRFAEIQSLKGTPQYAIEIEKLIKLTISDQEGLNSKPD